MTHLSSRVSKAAIEGRQFENLGEMALEVISTTREKADFCIESRGLSTLVADKRLFNMIKKYANSDRRLRFITNITPENISDCKVLLKYCDTVYHMDKVKGDFLISDERKYLFYIPECGLVKEKVRKPDIRQVLYNEDISFVITQQYLFENLCRNAIHAKEKIREIEREFRGEFTDIIDNASDIQRIVISSLESASYEILLLLSGEDSFYRGEYSGIINSLLQASQRGVIIKILLQSDDNQLRNIIQEIVDERQFAVNIQHVTKPLQNMM
jgi:hypothetical protein